MFASAKRITEKSSSKIQIESKDKLTEATRGQVQSDFPIEKIKHHPLLNIDHNSPLANLHVMRAAVSQYWYPISFFPEFLSNALNLAIAANDTTLSNRIKVIYDQESGANNPEAAHPLLYQLTMQKADMSIEQICKAPMNPATTVLMKAYQDAKDDLVKSVGILLGTERIDLDIVTGLGNLVCKVKDLELDQLEWFKIHVNQEPDHTECADKMLQNLLPVDQQKAEEYAKEICMLWLDFFDALSAA